MNNNPSTDQEEKQRARVELQELVKLIESAQTAGENEKRKRGDVEEGIREEHAPMGDMNHRDVQRHSQRRKRSNEKRVKTIRQKLRAQNMRGENVWHEHKNLPTC